MSLDGRLGAMKALISIAYVWQVSLHRYLFYLVYLANG